MDSGLPSVAKPSLNDFGGDDLLSLPAQFYCELFNALDPMLQQSLRNKMLAYIRQYRGVAKDGKGHVAAGFMLSGEVLEFDQSLYMEQVYRGKIDTYYIAAKEVHEKLLSNMKMIRSIRDEHLLELGLLTDEQRNSQLSVGSDVSVEVQAALAKMEGLIGLLDQKGDRG